MTTSSPPSGENGLDGDGEQKKWGHKQEQFTAVVSTTRLNGAVARLTEGSVGVDELLRVLDDLGVGRGGAGRTMAEVLALKQEAVALRSAPWSQAVVEFLSQAARRIPVSREGLGSQLMALLSAAAENPAYVSTVNATVGALLLDLDHPLRPDTRRALRSLTEKVDANWQLHKDCPSYVPPAPHAQRASTPPPPSVATDAQQIISVGPEAPVEDAGPSTGALPTPSQSSVTNVAGHTLVMPSVAAFLSSVPAAPASSAESAQTAAPSVASPPVPSEPPGANTAGNTRVMPAIAAPVSSAPEPVAAEPTAEERSPAPAQFAPPTHVDVRSLERPAKRSEPPTATLPKGAAPGTAGARPYTASGARAGAPQPIPRGAPDAIPLNPLGNLKLVLLLLGLAIAGGVGWMLTDELRPNGESKSDSSARPSALVPTPKVPARPSASVPPQPSAKPSVVIAPLPLPTALPSVSAAPQPAASASARVPPSSAASASQPARAPVIEPSPPQTPKAALPVSPKVPVAAVPTSPRATAPVPPQVTSKPKPEPAAKVDRSTPIDRSPATGSSKSVVEILDELRTVPNDASLIDAKSREVARIIARAKQPYAEDILHRITPADLLLGVEDERTLHPIYRVVAQLLSNVALDTSESRAVLAIEMLGLWAKNRQHGSTARWVLTTLRRDPSILSHPERRDALSRVWEPPAEVKDAG
jgi:hypothetical protein